jgi:hypothetical protein
MDIIATPLQINAHAEHIKMVMSILFTITGTALVLGTYLFWKGLSKLKVAPLLWAFILGITGFIMLFVSIGYYHGNNDPIKSYAEMRAQEIIALQMAELARKPAVPESNISIAVSDTGAYLGYKPVPVQTPEVKPVEQPKTESIKTQEKK